MTYLDARQYKILEEYNSEGSFIFIKCQILLKIKMILNSHHPFGLSDSRKTIEFLLSSF